MISRPLLVLSDEPGASAFVPWFYVDGLEAAMERVTATGGRILEPPSDKGDIRVVEIHDPAGNRLGLWQFA